MGKGIISIYKDDQRNCPNPPPSTNLFLPQSYETSLQTQSTSDYDASVGAHALQYSVSDQITSHHVNNAVNDNDD